VKRDIRWQVRTKSTFRIKYVKLNKQKNLHHGFYRRSLLYHHSWGQWKLPLIAYFLVYDLSTCIHIFLGGGCYETVLGQWFLVHRPREWMQPTTKRNLYSSSRSIRRLRCASGKIYLNPLMHCSQSISHLFLNNKPYFVSRVYSCVWYDYRNIINSLRASDAFLCHGYRACFLWSRKLISKPLTRSAFFKYFI
jgi:hypothetical protein